MDGTSISGFEGDQSQQGQGLAYVLPQSRTTGYFMQLANEKAQQRRDDAAALQQQQQKANDQYAQHLYQFKTPEIANEYTKWLQPQYDGLLKQAADYHAKTGQDPFVNPDFVSRTNDLNTTARNTHQANLRATAVATALADRSKNYTPESKLAANNWLQNYYKDPVGGLYNQPPPLEQRDLGLNDAIKAGHANSIVTSQNGYTITAPNTHNHIVQGQEILNQPEYAPLLQKQYGINTNVGDAFGQPNGKGGTIYPTDAPTINSIADHVLQNSQQPHYAATLQTAGIDPADPHAKDKLAELIQSQNTGYGRALTDFSSRLDASIEQKKVPDYNPERIDQGWQRIMDSEQRLRDSENKQAQKNAGSTYVQNLAEKSRNSILSQFDGGIKPSINNPFPELDDLYGSNQSYHHKLVSEVQPDGTIKVTVPAQYKYDAKAVKTDEDGKEIPNSGRVKIKDAYPVTFDPTQPDSFKSQYGQLFDQATGEKSGQPSKINTVGGKGKIPTQPQAQPNQQYTIKGKGYSSDAVSKAAAASGMSVDEYVKAVNGQ